MKPMQHAVVSEQTTLSFPLPLLVWALGAVLLGTILAIIGMAGFYILITVAFLLAFGIVTARYPSPVMGMAICFLGLFPYSWGIETHIIPKYFGDEALLLPYLAVSPFLYLFTQRKWQAGYSSVYLALIVLVSILALSFFVGVDPIALRNYIETIVLGSLLLVLFLQEGANSKPEVIAKFFVISVLAIAALSLIERVVQANPTIATDTGYLDANIIRLSGAIYRPYVSFFHPSEAGTFMALGVPFVVRTWLRAKSRFWFLALIVLAAALLVNSTRGVWVGLLFIAAVEIRSIWKVLIAALPLAAVCGWISYLLFRDTPLVQKLINPQDLFARFEYWGLAWRVFTEHPLLGVGHMQFREAYLAYAHNVSALVQFDIANVYVVDNMFLTTLAENGLLGSLTLLAFLVFMAFCLRQSRRSLESRQLFNEATFVRCCELALILYFVIGVFADVQLFTKATKLVFILIGLGLAQGARNGQTSKKAIAKRSLQPMVEV